MKIDLHLIIWRIIRRQEEQMKSSIFFVCIFFITSVSMAMAGELFGTIEDAGKPVPADVEVKVTVAGTENITAKTDKLGAYRVVATGKGKGTLTVTYKNKTSEPAEIISFDKATRYDWTIEASGDKMTLKRK
jgi:hypothetical protein